LEIEGHVQIFKLQDTRRLGDWIEKGCDCLGRFSFSFY